MFTGIFVNLVIRVLMNEYVIKFWNMSMTFRSCSELLHELNLSEHLYKLILLFVKVSYSLNSNKFPSSYALSLGNRAKCTRSNYFQGDVLAIIDNWGEFLLLFIVQVASWGC